MVADTDIARDVRHSLSRADDLVCITDSRVCEPRNSGMAWSAPIHSNKLAAAARLAAGMAHEIGKPMARIKSNLAVLEHFVEELFDLLHVYEQAGNQLPKDSPLSRAIEDANAKADLEFLRSDLTVLFQQSRMGVGRVSEIVQCLQKFPRHEAVASQVIDLHQVIEASISAVWQDLKPRSEVVRDYGCLPPMASRAEHLQVAFSNLLRNAVQAIDYHGSVNIRTHADDVYVTVEISDTGPGIAVKDIRRIFEPFYTTRLQGEGAGFGLYIANEIVVLHGGVIDVRSEIGKGSTFIVGLPHHCNKG